MESDSVYQSRQDGLIITAVAMTVIAATFVIMRSTSRFIVVRNSGIDDYFMVAAMALTICYVIMLFILRENRIGFPMKTLTPDNMFAFIKTTLAIQVMYYANIFCIKTSILVTYLRFAVSRTFRNLCYGTVGLHAVFFFICFVVTLAQCRPIQKMWDFTGAVPGSCIDTTAFFYFTSSFNILTDIWILGLPFKTLREIQRPTREKYALFAIFGVGAFAAIASIVRLHSIRIYTQSTDPFRDGIPVNLWSIIEVTVAISCASVPALKPIFSRRQRAATRAAKSASSGSGTQYTPSRSYSQSQMTYNYEPPQAYAFQPRHVRLESDASEARAQLTAQLGFHVQDPRPPPGDREHTESSGMSLGLPRQQPLPPSPPLAPRPMTQSRPSQQSITVPPPYPPLPRRSSSQTSINFARPLPPHSRTPSQTSIGRGGGPAIPQRRSSQRSVDTNASRNSSRGAGGGPGAPQRNASQTSIPSAMRGNGRPSLSRNVSWGSNVERRPGGPGRNASEESFYIDTSS